MRDGAAMSVRAILLCGPGGGILMERIYSPQLVHGAPEGRALWRQAIAGAASDLANALAEDEEVRKKGAEGEGTREGTCCPHPTCGRAALAFALQ